jgi:multiple sugar transport system ATP-binding protein
MGSVVFEQVSKVYADGTVAVHGLDVEARDGELLVLVGPSGCGKTSALRMVAGLEEISGGTLSIGGTVVNDVPSERRDIAMVFQNYALFPHLSVADNIGFGLKVRRVGKAEARRRVQEAAEILGLDQLLHRKPKELSGGQRQRVAMGRAIVRDPAVLLMDEPLSNLDAKLRVQMRAEITRIQRGLGATAIYVTHDQVEAMTMGDRIAVLRDGELQQIDTAQRIFDDPANVFVAGFVGSPPMNVLDAALELLPGGGAGSTLACRVGTDVLHLPADATTVRPGLAERAGRPIALGIRPDAISRAVAPSEAVPGRTLHATTQVVEMLGTENLVHAELDTGGGTTATVVARFDARTHPRLGEPLGLVVEVERLYFFDPESGAVIGRAASGAEHATAPSVALMS